MYIKAETSTNAKKPFTRKSIHTHTHIHDCKRHINTNIRSCKYTCKHAHGSMNTHKQTYVHANMRTLTQIRKLPHILMNTNRNIHSSFIYDIYHSCVDHMDLCLDLRMSETGCMEDRQLLMLQISPFHHTLGTLAPGFYHSITKRYSPNGFLIQNFPFLWRLTLTKVESSISATICS